MDGAAFVIDVEDITIRPDLEADRVRCAGHEGLDPRWIREAVRARKHRPDAVSRVVREEQSAFVGGRVASTVVERQAGDR